MNKPLEFIPVSEIFGLLVTMAIASTLILSVAWAVTLFMNRSSAAKRYTVWMTASSILLLVPIGYQMLPTIPLGIEFAGPSVMAPMSAGH